MSECHRGSAAFDRNENPQCAATCDNPAVGQTGVPTELQRCGKAIRDGASENHSHESK